MKPIVFVVVRFQSMILSRDMPVHKVEEASMEHILGPKCSHYSILYRFLRHSEEQAVDEGNGKAS